jgi:hypothetical protein
MLLQLVLESILLIIEVQCNKSEFYNSPQSYATQEKVPDFCDEHYIDSAFSNEKNEIRMTRKDWIWTFDENKQKLEPPQKQDPSIYSMSDLYCNIYFIIYSQNNRRTVFIAK